MAEEVLRLGVDPTRAEEGFRKYQRAAKDAQGVTQGFDKSMVLMATRVGTSLASVAAAGVAYTIALGKMAEAGGKVLDTQRAFERVAGDYTTAIRSLQQATSGLVSEQDLVVQFNRALTLGSAKNVQDFGQLSQAAISLGKALGVDAGFALESLSLGIGRQSRMILDNLGLIVSVEEANRAYAASLGRTAESLTDNEQKEAFRAAALSAVAAKVEELGGSTLNAGDAWVQFVVELKNAKAEFQAIIAQSEAVESFFSTLAMLVREARGESSALHSTLASLGMVESLGALQSRYVDFLKLIPSANRSIDENNKILTDAGLTAKDVGRVLLYLEGRIEALTKTQKDGTEATADYDAVIERLNEQLAASAVPMARWVSEGERMQKLAEALDDAVTKAYRSWKSLNEVTGNSATMIAHANAEVEAVVNAWAQADHSQQGAVDSLREINAILAMSGVEFEQLLPLIQEYIERIRAASNENANFKQPATDAQQLGGAFAGGFGGTFGNIASSAITGGWMGLGQAVAGALGKALGGLFGGGDAQREAERQAMEQAARNREAQERANREFAEAVKDFAEAVGGTPDTIRADFEATYGQSFDAAERSLEALIRAMREAEEALAAAREAAKGGGDQGETYATEADELERHLEALREEYNRTAESLAAYQARLAAVRQAYIEDLSVRELAARGMDDEAAKLQLSLQQQREYAAAVRDGWDEVALAQLAAVQALEFGRFLDDLAAAMRESAEAARQAAEEEKALAAERRRAENEAFRVLGEDLTVRALAMTGRGSAAEQAALAAAQRREALGLADQPAEVRELVEVLHGLERAALSDEQRMTEIRDAANEQIAALEAQASAVREQTQAQANAAREQLAVANDQLRAQERAVAESRRAYESLRNYALSLQVGALSPLSRTAKLDEARSQFEALTSQALAGDAGAAGNLSGAASTYLTALRNVYASSTAYATGFAQVQDVIAQVQGRFGAQLSVDERILAELQAHTGKLQAQVEELSSQTGVQGSQLAAIEAAMAEARASADAQIAAIEADAAGRALDMQAQIDALLEQIAILQAIKDSQEEILEETKKEPPGGFDLPDWWDDFITTDPGGGGGTIEFDPDILSPMVSQQQATVSVLSSGFSTLSSRLQSVESRIGDLTDTNRSGFESLAGSGWGRDW